MARLIDADELKRLTCEWCNKARPEEPCEPSECSIMWFHDAQPTVDAVEVVRCKDCIYHNDIFCKMNEWKQPDDGFCCYGERKVTDHEISV